MKIRPQISPSFITPAFAFYEYRARAYHPGLGRFMSEDPKLFDAGDYNLFRYCHNDPVDFADPMGTVELEPWPTHRQQAGAMDRLWEMTKWFDRSNVLQGNFAGFGALSGQSDRDAKGGLYIAQIAKDPRHYSKQSDARHALAYNLYDLQESMDPRREYNAAVSQNNDNPSDFITTDPARGSIGSVPKDKYGHGGYQNYSSIPIKDPSPEGYHRVAVVYTHLNWRKDIDLPDRRAFFELKVNATLATPAQAGSRMPSPNIINWDWATGAH
jgi:RHS repeat-associated protein